MPVLHLAEGWVVGKKLPYLVVLGNFQLDEFGSRLSAAVYQRFNDSGREYGLGKQVEHFKVRSATQHAADS